MRSRFLHFLICITELTLSLKKGKNLYFFQGVCRLSVIFYLTTSSFSVYWETCYYFIFIIYYFIFLLYSNNLIQTETTLRWIKGTNYNLPYQNQNKKNATICEDYFISFFIYISSRFCVACCRFFLKKDCKSIFSSLAIGDRGFLIPWRLIHKRFSKSNDRIPGQFIPFYICIKKS